MKKLSYFILIAVSFTTIYSIFDLKTNRGENLTVFSGRPPLLSVSTVQGTGVSVDPNGYILTNKHVVSKCQKIVVSTENLDHDPAQLVLLSRDVDLALLKVRQSNRPYLAISDWDASIKWSDIHSLDEIGETTKQVIRQMPQPLKILGYPASYSGGQPTQAQARFETSLAKAGSYWFPQLTVASEVGESGSPLIDAHDMIVGLLFEGIFSRERAEASGSTGVRTFADAGFVPAAILRRLLAPVIKLPEHSVTYPDQSPIYRVFCFRRLL